MGDAKRLTPTARKVLEHVAANGATGAQPIMQLLWREALSQHTTTDRRHGYRRLAGATLARYQRAGWLRSVNTLLNWGTAVNEYDITHEGRIALAADRKLGEVQPCAARVEFRVPGCTPPNVQRRPCKRNALAGSPYCRQHHNHEGTDPQ